MNPGTAGQTVVKNVSTSINLGSFSDPGVNDGPWIVSINWGDKKSSTFTTSNAGALTASHAYATAGTYNAVVTVSDIDGATGSASTSLNVSTAGPLSAIFANAGAVNEGNVGTVTFSNIIGGVGPYTYSYDFDNNGVFEIAGSRQAWATVPPQYLNPGSQTVQRAGHGQHRCIQRLHHHYHGQRLAADGYRRRRPDRPQGCICDIRTRFVHGPRRQ